MAARTALACPAAPASPAEPGADSEAPRSARATVRSLPRAAPRHVTVQLGGAAVRAGAPRVVRTCSIPLTLMEAAAYFPVVPVVVENQIALLLSSQKVHVTFVGPHFSNSDSF